MKFINVDILRTPEESILERYPGLCSEGSDASGEPRVTTSPPVFGALFAEVNFQMRVLTFLSPRKLMIEYDKL